ncbi:MAG: hypothetical protein AAFR90_12535 [Pseudomonadota bacterium]
MNHAPKPNTDFTSPSKGWAIRDIAIGEEITCNYYEFIKGVDETFHFSNNITPSATY